MAEHECDWRIDVFCPPQIGMLRLVCAEPTCPAVMMWAGGFMPNGKGTWPKAPLSVRPSK